MPDITVSITVPEAHVDRVGAATASTTKAELETWIKNKIKNEVIAYEAEQARLNVINNAPDVEADAEAARVAAKTAAEAEITIN